MEGPVVVLRFRDDGPAYERAKAVADALGLSIQDYLLSCISEGHRMLRAQSQVIDREEPAYIRRGLAVDWADGVRIREG